MPNLFKTPAQLTSIKSKVDRSYSLTFNTRELDPLGVAELSANLMAEGTLGFATDDKMIDELDHLEVPEEILEVGQKSFAERARAVAFLRWKNKGEPETFDIYWSRLKEEIIGQLKKGLPPRES
jgi:hypothetical protein